MVENQVSPLGSANYPTGSPSGSQEFVEVYGQRNSERKSSSDAKTVQDRTLFEAKIRLVNNRWRVFFEPGIRTAEGLILKSIDAEMEWDTDGIKGFRVPNIPMISPNLEQEFYNEKDMVTK